MIDIASIKTEQILADILDQIGFISDSPDPVRFTGNDKFPSRCLFWKTNPDLAYPVGVMVNGSELDTYYYDFCNDWFTYFDTYQGSVSEDELRQLIIDTSIPKLILLDADNDWSTIFAYLGVHILPDQMSPEEAAQYRKACIVDAASNALPKDVKIVLNNDWAIAFLVCDPETRQFVSSGTSLPRLMAESLLKRTIQSVAREQVEFH